MELIGRWRGNLLSITHGIFCVFLDIHAGIGTQATFPNPRNQSRQSPLISTDKTPSQITRTPVATRRHISRVEIPARGGPSCHLDAVLDLSRPRSGCEIEDWMGDHVRARGVLNAGTRLIMVVHEILK